MLRNRHKMAQTQRQRQKILIMLLQPQMKATKRRLTNNPRTERQLPPKRANTWRTVNTTRIMSMATKVTRATRMEPGRAARKEVGRKSGPKRVKPLLRRRLIQSTPLHRLRPPKKLTKTVKAQKTQTERRKLVRRRRRQREKGQVQVMERCRAARQQQTTERPKNKLSCRRSR